MRRWGRTITLAAMLALLDACDTETAAEVDAVTTISSVAATTSSGSSSVTLHASLVPETMAGSAPAMVHCANDSSHYATLDLPGALFYQVPSGEQSLPQLAVSANLTDDVRVGYCDTPGPNVACIWIELASLTGPTLLEPTSAYEMRVSEEPVDSWHLDVTEQALPAPFRAVRAWGKPFDVGSRQIVIVAGAGTTVEADLPIADLPSTYTLLPARETALATVSYVDHTGVEHSGTLDATLDGAYGFTVVVDTAATPGAVADVELDPPLASGGPP